jgi:hypothetical protein
MVRSEEGAADGIGLDVWAFAVPSARKAVLARADDTS